MKRCVIALLLAVLILFGASFGLKGTAAKNAQEAHLTMLRTLLPDAQDFTLEPYSGEDANIRSVHKSDIGYVVETVTYGYAGEITMLIGVNNAGKVTGLVVQEAHETFGLGNQALTDHVFLSQFLNRTGTFAVAAHGGVDAFSSATGEETAAGGETVDVDAITGATVTTKAVIRCVNSAVAFVTGADASSSATEWGG